MIRSSLRIFVSFDISIPPPPIIGNSNAHLGHFVFKTLSSWVHVWSCSPLLHSYVLMMSSVPSNPPCCHNGRACNNEGMASPVHGVSLPSLLKVTTT